MGATLKLDKFQLLWFFEGAAGKSHLRWDIYRIFVNKIWGQLTEDEREFVYTYVKRDSGWLFDEEPKLSVDKTAKSYFERMLARFNPANQYLITLSDGKQTIQSQAYLFEGRYWSDWEHWCSDEYIKDKKHLPFKKCENEFCVAKGDCLRYTTRSEGDELFRDNGVWPCKKCDLIIEK